MICNTAVFYDIENLLGLFTLKSSTVVHLDEIYRRIQEVEGVSGISIQKAYADWAMPINRYLRNSVLQIGIEPVQIFNTNQNDKVKNAADVSLIIDAVELIARRPDIENYVIVSGDGIFAFLSKKLHEYGKRVIGCGFSRNTNNIFRNACDYFITLEKTDKTLTAVRTNGKNAPPSLAVPEEKIEESVPSPVPVPVEAKKEKTKLDKKILGKFPKNKYSEILSRANIPVWKSGSDPLNGLRIITALVNTLFQNNPDESADLEISVFKIYLDYYTPGLLKLSPFRFKRFSEFMRFLLTGSPYCLYTAEGTILRVTRRGMVGEKGEVMEDLSGLQINLSDGRKVNSLFDVPEHMPFTYTMPPSGKNGTASSKNGKQTKEKPTKTEAVKAEATPFNQAAESTTMRDAPLARPESFDAVLPEPELPSILASDGAESEADEADTFEDKGLSEGSLRKSIKAVFMKLSLNNSLLLEEAFRLTTPVYSQKTFGIKTPILKEVSPNGNLQEQRMANGRIKYWKEVFRYNGKSYLVYKEWTASQHRERFSNWLAQIESNSEQNPDQQTQ